MKVLIPHHFLKVFSTTLVGFCFISVWSQSHKVPVGKDTTLPYTNIWYVDYSLDVHETKVALESTDFGWTQTAGCNLHLNGTAELHIVKDGLGNEMFNDDGTISSWYGFSFSQISYYGEYFLAGANGERSAVGDESYFGQGTSDTGIVSLDFNYDDNTYDLKVAIGDFKYEVLRDFGKYDAMRKELESQMASDPSGVSGLLYALTYIPDSLKKGKASLVLALGSTTIDFSNGGYKEFKIKLPTNGRNMQGSVELPLLNFFKGTFSWKIRPDKFVERKLIVTTQNESDYLSWLPMHEKNPNYKPLMVKAKLDITNTKLKDDSLIFYLTDVSNYKGYCGNEPEDKKANKSADMVFAPQLEQPAGIYYIDSFHVSTDKKVKEATVKIICRDYAAYGVLKVKAINQNIVGKNNYDKSEFLRLPKDDDFNKIADYWEDNMAKMHQISTNWDDEGEKGQTLMGDNISFFDEYRGFKIIKDNVETNEEFIRADPNQREIFVYDKEKFSDAQSWENASGIKMYHTSEKQLFAPVSKTDGGKWRCVNFNGEGKKMAIGIKKIDNPDPTYDPDNSGDVNNGGYDPAEWGGSMCYAGIDNLIHFFPTRIKLTIKKYLEFVQSALNPLDPLGCKEPFIKLAADRNMTVVQLDSLARINMPKWLSDAYLDKLTKEYMKFIVIHEMGHCCYVVGHSRPRKKPNGDPYMSNESTEGDDHCVMKYVSWYEKLELVIFSAPNNVAVPDYFGRTKFCKGGQDNCYGKVDAKNK